MRSCVLAAHCLQANVQILCHVMKSSLRSIFSDSFHASAKLNIFKSFRAFWTILLPLPSGSFSHFLCLLCSFS